MFAAMRAGIENWLLRHWYGGGQPPWVLRILEPLYRLVSQRIQKKGQTGPDRFRPGLPLIVVGNLTAGGSGKTPLVIRLCELAIEAGLKPGIASTGYGRKSHETLVVHADSDTQVCGDEPVLLAQRTVVPVVVAAKRIDAVKKLAEMNLDLLISDDGLQQADLDRDIEICVVDGERGLGNGHLLPAGPLREPAGRLGQVDYVVTNGEWSARPDNLEVSIMGLRVGVVRSLDDSKEYPLEDFRQYLDGSPVHAVAAIGNPDRFFRMLDTLGITAEHQGFPDHHSFTSADFESMRDGSAIIMTEKDAVKCRSLGLQNAWYVPVVTSLSGGFEQVLKNHMVKLTGENK